MTTGKDSIVQEQSTERVAKTFSGRFKRIMFWGVLAVIICLGIAWILFPQYGDYTPRAKVSEVLLGTYGASEQVTEFYQNHKRLPLDATEVNLLPPYSDKIRALTYDGTKGELRAVIQNIPQVNGKSLILRADIRGDRLVWVCLNDGIPKEHLAGICRPN